jgi:Spy/CpxP family protein refolding chaperone
MTAASINRNAERETMNRSSTAKRTLAATTIGIAALAATVAVAQPPAYSPGPGYGPTAQTAPADWAQARLDRMAWRLNLTEEQKAKLKPILEERQAFRTAQRAAMRNQLAQVLTPQQLAQFDQMRGQRGWRRFGGGPCGGGYGPGMGYGPGPGFGPTN